MLVCIAVLTSLCLQLTMNAVSRTVNEILDCNLVTYFSFNLIVINELLQLTGHQIQRINPCLIFVHFIGKPKTDFTEHLGSNKVETFRLSFFFCTVRKTGDILLSFVSGIAL